MSVLTGFRKHRSSLAHSAAIYAQRVTLKDRIKHARTEAGLSQSALARACKVDPSAINKLESGETKALSSALLLKMSEVLSVDSGWLASGRAAKASIASRAPEPIDPVLIDLAALDPDDAALWRAQIRVAANKARRTTSDSGPPEQASVAPKRRHSG